MRKLNYKFNYQVKAEEGENNSVIIEGYANRSFKDGQMVIDRGKEFIPLEEWKYEEWLENPIILFNHDRSMPIGRGIDVKVTDEGLFLKAQISNSDVPEIKKVRDLIKEKILNSFSVGIDVKSEEEVDGVYHLKGVNLLETSVVALPMNQASTFTTNVKMLKEKSIGAIREEITKEKGAVLASQIHAAIGKMQENQDFSREDLLLKIAKEAEISLDELFEFLAGNIVRADDKLLTILSMNLGIEEQTLKDLNEIDASLNQQKIERPEEEQENDEDPKETEEGKINEGENDELLQEEEDNQDDMVLEDEEEDEEEKEKTNVNTQSFNDCVSKHIREGLDHGKTQDQAIAYALEKCRDEKSCNLDLKMWNHIFDEIEMHNKELGGGIAPELGTEGTIEQNPGNAQVQEARQTNVLLSQLIGEIQQLKKIFASAMLATPQNMQGISLCLNDENVINKDENLDILEDYHRKLDERLKKLGV
jgi:HK97 family phage prohead protease